MNGVGYNTTENEAEDTMVFVGASFENVGEGEFIPLSAIQCVEGFEDGDQFQTSFMDEIGAVNFKIYEYWDGDGWADPDSMEIVGDNIGFTLGQAAWFISSSPKKLTFAGGVHKDNFIHTFEESMTIATSAFPVPFCPNSANVSWGCNDGDQIQTSFMDEIGAVNFKIYEYWDGDGWADPDTMEIIEPDFAVVTPGKGFWFITSDPESVTFSEVSPLAE